MQYRKRLKYPIVLYSTHKFDVNDPGIIQINLKKYIRNLGKNFAENKN